MTIFKYYIRKAGVTAIALTIVLASTTKNANAEQADKIKFLGTSITSAPGNYKVLDNVNVRAKPSTKGKRIGGLKKGERVKAVGRAKSSDGKKWLAIRKEAKEFGFVYERALEFIETVEPDFSIALTPVSGKYLVIKDVNIRAEPGTSSAKVGRLDKGERVEAIGKPDGKSWLGVKQGEKKLGYIFMPAMLPLIDGALNKKISAKTTVPNGPECDYSIRYDTMNSLEGELSGTFDYDISYKCKNAKKTFEFLAFMFITEASYDLSNNKIYQVNVDILDIGDRFDDVMSVIFMYKSKENILVFDSISQDEFGKTPPTREKEAYNVDEALLAAAEIAPGAWNSRVWQVLSSRKLPDYKK